MTATGPASATHFSCWRSHAAGAPIPRHERHDPCDRADEHESEQRQARRTRSPSRSPQPADPDRVGDDGSGVGRLQPGIQRSVGHRRRRRLATTSRGTVASPGEGTRAGREDEQGRDHQHDAGDPEPLAVPGGERKQRARVAAARRTRSASGRTSTCRPIAANSQPTALPGRSTTINAPTRYRRSSQESSSPSRSLRSRPRSFRRPRSQLAISTIVAPAARCEPLSSHGRSAFPQPDRDVFAAASSLAMTPVRSARAGVEARSARAAAPRTPRASAGRRTGGGRSAGRRPLDARPHAGGTALRRRGSTLRSPGSSHPRTTRTAPARRARARRRRAEHDRQRRRRRACVRSRGRCRRAGSGESQRRRRRAAARTRRQRRR